MVNGVREQVVLLLREKQGITLCLNSNSRKNDKFKISLILDYKTVSNGSEGLYDYCCCTCSKETRSNQIFLHETQNLQEVYLLKNSFFKKAIYRTVTHHHLSSLREEV